MNREVGPRGASRACRVPPAKSVSEAGWASIEVARWRAGLRRTPDLPIRRCAMRVDSASGGQERRAGGSRPDRRAFLRVGAGCAVPLVAGGVLASRGLAGSAEAAAPGPTGQDAVGPVLAHIEQELARTYHAMRGPAGVRGEHVRSLAANLELVGVCVQARKDDVRAEAAIRRRIEDRGRDGMVQECLAALDDLSADIAVQHGIVRRTTCEPARIAAALDAVAAKGLTFNVRGH